MEATAANWEEKFNVFLSQNKSVSLPFDFPFVMLFYSCWFESGYFWCARSSKTNPTLKRFLSLFSLLTMYNVTYYGTFLKGSYSIFTWAFLSSFLLLFPPFFSLCHNFGIRIARVFFAIISIQKKIWILNDIHIPYKMYVTKIIFLLSLLQ